MITPKPTITPKPNQKTLPPFKQKSLPQKVEEQETINEVTTPLREIQAKYSPDVKVMPDYDDSLNSQVHPKHSTIRIPYNVRAAYVCYIRAGIAHQEVRTLEGLLDTIQATDRDKMDIKTALKVLDEFRERWGKQLGIL